MAFNHCYPHSTSSFRFGLLCLAALTFIILIYSNSFHCSWHYDDTENIVKNENIRLQSLDWKGVKQSFYTFSADRRLRIHRPLAFLSFALNYLVGKYNVWGYHLVNISVHLITAVVIFGFIVMLLRTPKLQGRYGSDAHIIAFVATLLWAAHPVQVTAVTYIVQRMASMAAMFSIISLYAYLKGRLTPRPLLKYFCYLISLLAFLAGLASKENAIVLPFCILIMDLFIIRSVDNDSIKRWITSLCLVLVLVGVLISIVVFYGDLNIPASYPDRPYTPVQRLLTEPRVLFSYMLWIAMPMRSKLTLIHDIDYSHTLFEPITTLPAIVGIVGGAVAMIILARKYPLTAFCGLFFLIGHSVEASFLNLGLVYEHRNYLPSMMVFVPPSAWFIRFVNRKDVARGWRMGCFSVLVMLILSNGHTVFNYNKVFRSEWSLWFDAVVKSPSLSVTHLNFGKVLWNGCALEKANEEFILALKLNRWGNLTEKGIVHHNLGLYQTYVAMNYQAALEQFQKAIENWEGNQATWYHLGGGYLKTGQVDDAEKYTTRALSHWPQNLELMVLMSVIELRKGNCDKALSWAEQAQYKAPLNKRLSILAAEIHRCSGRRVQAEQYYHDYMASKADPLEKHKAITLFSSGIAQHNLEERIEYDVLLLELTGIDSDLRSRCFITDTVVPH